jgi:hypothetical protein
MTKRLAAFMLVFVASVLVAPFALAQVVTATPVPTGPPAPVIDWLTSGIGVLVALIVPVLTAVVKSVLTKLPSWASPVIVFGLATAATTLAGVVVPAGKFSWAMTLGVSFLAILVRELKLAVVGK